MNCVMSLFTVVKAPSSGGRQKCRTTHKLDKLFFPQIETNKRKQLDMKIEGRILLSRTERFLFIY